MQAQKEFLYYLLEYGSTYTDLAGESADLTSTTMALIDMYQGYVQSRTLRILCMHIINLSTDPGP